MLSALAMPDFRCRLVLELSHSDCLPPCSTSVMVDLQPVCVFIYLQLLHSVIHYSLRAFTLCIVTCLLYSLSKYAKVLFVLFMFSVVNLLNTDGGQYGQSVMGTVAVCIQSVVIYLWNIECTYGLPCLLSFCHCQ